MNQPLCILKKWFFGLFVHACLVSTCLCGSDGFAVIRDAVYQPNGEAFEGAIKIVPNGFPSAARPPTVSVPVQDGMLLVRVTPTLSTGASYKVSFLSSNGSTSWIETWHVPASSRLHLADVRAEGDAGSLESPKTISVPIPITGVVSLSSSLSHINSSLGTLGTTLSTLSSSIQTVLSNTLILGETPAGSINGGNSIFVLVNAPSADTLRLYRNGQRQTMGTDFSLSGHTLTFISTSIPQPGDVLAADYIAVLASKRIQQLDVRDISLPLPINDVAGLSAALNGINNSVSTLTVTANTLTPEVAQLTSVVPINGEAPAGAINGTNGTFTLHNLPLAAQVTVYRNGVRQTTGGDFNLSGQTLTFSSRAIPQAGDLISVDYRTQ